LIENAVISSDRLADDQRFGLLQCASYLLAARHFADAGAAGIVAKNDNIAGEKRRMRAGEIEQHVVVPGHRYNQHFGDFRRRRVRPIGHGCDLVVHYSSRVVRILRRQGGAIGRDSEIFVLAARFVLSFHSAKIAALPDFSKVKP
jgi:hypothetical protein